MSWRTGISGWATVALAGLGLLALVGVCLRRPIAAPPRRGDAVEAVTSLAMQPPGVLPTTQNASAAGWHCNDAELKHTLCRVLLGSVQLRVERWLGTAMKFSVLLCLPWLGAGEARPGTGVFEPWLHDLWAQPTAQALDVRVAKGLGSKGYQKVRISVVAPQQMEVKDFNFTYQQCPSVEDPELFQAVQDFLQLKGGSDVPLCSLPGIVCQKCGVVKIGRSGASAESIQGDLSFLRRFPELREVDLSWTRVTGDLSSLRNLSKLEKVDLRQTQVSGKLASLEYLTKLKELYLDHPEVSGDLKSLESARLEWLDLDRTKVSGELTSLKKMTGLKRLYLRSTQISGNLKMDTLPAALRVDVGDNSQVMTVSKAALVEALEHSIEVGLANTQLANRAEFRYRWTDNFLHSALVDAKVGTNVFSIGGHELQVELPAENGGIRALFWSDPCFSSKWITCAYAEKFQTFPRSVAMLNNIFADPTMDMFSILGDNFYDQTGELAKTLFNQLSLDVKRRFLLVVNGNHDNWVCGGPNCGGSEDNFGIGQMQYYTADPVASRLVSDNALVSGEFMDFSVDPDARKAWKSFQNVGTNFLVAGQIFSRR
eukprot:g7206.t1